VIASSLSDRAEADDVPPWLDELLHAPDPKVRMLGLEAWAQHPGAFARTGDLRARRSGRVGTCADAGGVWEELAW